jgi:hypothetical protein
MIDLGIGIFPKDFQRGTKRTEEQEYRISNKPVSNGEVGDV